MLEYAGSQRAGLQRNRGDGLTLVGVLRSLDWLLVAGVAGLVAVGLWAISGVTRFDVSGDPHHYLKRQGVYVPAGAGPLRFWGVFSPEPFTQFWRTHFTGPVTLC